MAVGANPCGRPLPVLMYSKHIENWYYLQTWDTSLRYESKLPSEPGLETEDLIQGAKRICGLVRTEIRRHGSRKR
jgi:hypothetical protein